MPIPASEGERLAALHAYGVIDTDNAQTLDTIACIAARIANCPIALVSLVDADRLWFKARHGLELVGTARQHGFCSYAILDPSRPLIVSDVAKDTRFAGNPLVVENGVVFYAGMPLMTADGHALGTLCILDRKPREIDADTLGMLATLAQSVMAALDVRRAARQVIAYATMDMMTGLGNRSAFLRAIDTAIAGQRRDGRPFGLVLIDMDQFEIMNEKLGATAGDAVLKVVGNVLRSYFPEAVCVARIGSDEFGMVVMEQDRPSDIADIAERARALLEASVAAHGYAVTACIGGLAFPEPPADSNAAISAAMAVLTAARLQGPNSVLCREVGERAVAPAVRRTALLDRYVTAYQSR